MVNSEIKLPVYSKLAQVILGLIGFFYILFIGQEIIIPLLFALIIAILLNPVVNFLTGKGLNRVIAIFLALILTVAVLASVMYFIIFQLSHLSDSSAEFKQKFTLLFNDIINWVSQTFNISKEKISAWLVKVKGKGMENGGVVIGQTLTTISGVLIYTFLLPVYIFMILFYKSLLLEFIARLFRNNKQEVVVEVLQETKSLIQNYLVGLLIEVVIVATLNTTGLLIIGLDYAILIGVIGALLNMIPYIGGLVAISIPMLLAVATKEPIDALYVFGVYMLVQFIDNNFIVPKIVASKVKINALVSIVVVLIGGALWGVAGMFLSIPLTAILKVIFDRIDSLTPFGFLLGDDQPDHGKITLNFKKPRKKTVKKSVVKN